MTQPVDPRLRKLLGGDELVSLRRRLRRHFERCAVDTAPTSLRVSGLSSVEHEALAQLVGASARQAKSMQVDLVRLDGVLRDAGVAASLRDALERLDGPIVHRATAQARAQARWDAVSRACRNEALAHWLEAPASFGLLKRLARQDAEAAAHLVECAQEVLQRLPVRGLPRAQLAAETLGDAHALDAGQPVATLVLAALRQRKSDARQASDRSPSYATAARYDDAPGDPSDGPTDSTNATADASEERARDVWARAGVLVNELARPALFLNLPVRASDTPLSPPGEPGYLSLRRLLRAPPAFEVSERDVFVCENPNLVAIAAAQLGAGCGALVCTDGMPAAAQRTLLGQLAQRGARLRYHGDFDWPGLRIGNRVMRDFSATAWRFGARDYEAAVHDTPRRQHQLRGESVAASWDGELAPTMRRSGLAIAEEAVAASLLADLCK